MNDKQTTRRKFLQFVGLSAGDATVSTTAFASGFDMSEIKKLNSKQQEFMMRYEQWMTAYIKVIRIQNSDPDNIENHKRMILLTQRAEKFQPELTGFLKDLTFALIYKVSIERMTKEIA